MGSSGTSRYTRSSADVISKSNASCAPSSTRWAAARSSEHDVYSHSYDMATSSCYGCCAIGGTRRGEHHSPATAGVTHRTTLVILRVPQVGDLVRRPGGAVQTQAAGRHAAVAG